MTSWRHLTKADKAAITEQIQRSGLRIYLTVGRGGHCRARLWHCDGHVIAQAGGYGYDRCGSALVEAIGKLWPEALRDAQRAYVGQNAPAHALHGGVGLETIREAFRYAGYDVHDYSARSDVIFILQTQEQTDRQLAEGREHAKQRAADHAEHLASKGGGKK